MVDWRIAKSDCTTFLLLDITCAVFFSLYTFSFPLPKFRPTVFHFVCLQNNLCFSVSVHMLISHFF